MLSAVAAETLSAQGLRQVLGDARAELLELVAEQARARGLRLYLVGGVVRDIALGIASHDLDFALDADARRFADDLAREFGGAVLAHGSFGTAVWQLDASMAVSLGRGAEELPSHIDFARARTETYTQPAALPTVRYADIQADLRRRDFTLNALAIRLSPGNHMALIDPCAGLDDLRGRRIRVLHERSFIDDPTRILRAVKLATRLGFTIEGHTHALLRAALPLLARLSGARLMRELDLMLDEAMGADMLKALAELGALREIQPAFRIEARLPEQLKRLHATPASSLASHDKRLVAWCLLLAGHQSDEAAAICQRLDLPGKLSKAALATTELLSQRAMLADASLPHSHIVRQLDGRPEAALLAARICLAECPLAHDRLGRYLREWRHQRATINGDDLARMGLPPGPRYRQILDGLRFGWIDGHIKNAADEEAALRQLLAVHDG